MNRVQRDLKKKIGPAKFSRLFLEAAKMHFEKGQKKQGNHCLDVVIDSDLEDMEERANLLTLPERRILADLRKNPEQHRKAIGIIDGLRN